ncbi:MAG: hypothetical protein IPK24_22235 [Kineosporiaceae bacterium]|nr:hypothetical protein [Kineosporiaceae bacterium]
MPALETNLATSPGPERDPASGPQVEGSPDAAAEAALWQILREDPNDVAAFHRLADVVRRHAADRHVDSPGVDRQRAMDDAVWSLAEELAHSGKAWYPLVELARLSLHDDRDAAMRRLGTAAERDPVGLGLATSLQMLREAGLPGVALNLGMGHWRPREHTDGRHMVESAIESARPEARRHLEALGRIPRPARLQQLHDELLLLIEAAQAGPTAAHPGGGLPLIDLRELRAARERVAQGGVTPTSGDALAFCLGRPAQASLPESCPSSPR